MFIPLLIVSALTAFAKPELPRRIGLEGTWRLVQETRGLAIPATVPGVVQVDLIRAGIIPDPYLGENEKAVQWVSDLPWRYSRRFTVDHKFLANRRIVLRCEGLDTFATIKINGKTLAKTDNMFRTWEFDAKPLLKEGDNSIQVDFETLANFLQRNKDRPQSFGKPVQEGGKPYIRKPAFQGGWDFAPKLLTMGIWRGIGLVGWRGARLTDVAIVQDHTRRDVVGLNVKLSADTSEATWARTIVLFKKRQVAEADSKLVQGSGQTRLAIPNPQLWWPNEMGPQNLYEVRVELRDAEGRLQDEGSRRIGLRTITWIPKTTSSPLALMVNGRRFFAKGSNWVPFDSLLRENPKRERQLVQKAVDAHMNLMRLWGGGYYVDDAFLDSCDEKGLLTWFEFGYADSPYPSFDPVWLENAKAEAEDNVRRVRHHPSIAVFSGNNEVIDRIADKTSSWQMSKDEYEFLFRRTLRDVVHDLAPNDAYTPGSPEIGDEHYWDVWHGNAAFSSYRTRHGFMSEYGFQAFAVPRSVDQFTTPAGRASVETPQMLQHEKNWRDGDALIVSTLRRYYRKPKDFDSTLWLSQIDQADGILTGVEHWRRDWPNSTASLVWQFNDPWPGTSWSMIDWYGRPKSLYYALKRAYAPVALSGLADAKTGDVQLLVVNDRAVAKRGEIEWAVTRLDGTTLKHGTQVVAIPSGTSSVRAFAKNFGGLIEKEGVDKLLLWANLKTPGEPVSKTLLTFAKARELNLVDPEIRASLKRSPRGYRVTLISSRPALRAWIELKGMDADLSDNFVDLRPGRPVDIEVAPVGKVSLSQMQAALRVRSLFDTYAPGTGAYAIVHPDAEGRIVASADDADVQGNEPVLESGAPSDLGNWRSIDSEVRWTVHGAKPGAFTVTALVSAPSSDAGGTFEVSVDGSRLSGTVPITKSWTDYVVVRLGTVTIQKDGTTTISIRPVTKPHDNLMNLRSITLTPAKG
jgi:beta-mannosidase